MTKEEFLNKVLEVGTTEDDVARRTLLTEITDEVSKVYDEVGVLNTTIDSLNTNLNKVNDDLTKAQKANMELFLRVGTPKTETEVNNSNAGVDSEPEKLKFEDLFKSN